MCAAYKRLNALVSKPFVGPSTFFFEIHGFEWDERHNGAGPVVLGSPPKHREGAS